MKKNYGPDKTSQYTISGKRSPNVQGKAKVFVLNIDPV